MTLFIKSFMLFMSHNFRFGDDTCNLQSFHNFFQPILLNKKNDRDNN